MRRDADRHTDPAARPAAADDDVGKRIGTGRPDPRRPRPTRISGSPSARPYVTRSSVSPFAGARLPAPVRSRAARIRAMSSGKSEPSPTRTSEPTIARTIWCRNAFARNRSTIRSPSRDDGRALQSPHRRLAVPRMPTERREVMLADQMPRRRPHRSQVQSGGSVPLDTAPETDPTPAPCRSRTDTPEPAPKTAHETPRAPPKPRRRPPPAPSARSRTPEPARASVARTSRTTPPARSHARPHRSAPPPPAAHPPPRVRGNNSRSTPSTVRTEASRCDAHPRNPVPSYARSSRMVRSVVIARQAIPNTKAGPGGVREPAQAPKAPSSSRTSPGPARCSCRN